MFDYKSICMKRSHYHRNMHHKFGDLLASRDFVSDISEFNWK